MSSSADDKEKEGRIMREAATHMKRVRENN
jgi:hypothetical protein